MGPVRATACAAVAGRRRPGSRRPSRRCGSCGRAAGCAAWSALLGPAFVAAVAYVDPGNFATNFTAGAKFGYTLVWVIVVANLMAMLVQYLSAKAGVATGRDLPELCREHLPRPVVPRPVGAGRDHRDGHRPGRVRRRRGRALPALRRAAVPGRADHRGRRVRASSRWSSAATGASSSRSSACSASCSSGFLYDLRRRRRRPGRRRGRAGPPTSPAATACCWSAASSARPSCRTWSTCTRR